MTLASGHSNPKEIAAAGGWAGSTAAGAWEGLAEWAFIMAGEDAISRHKIKLQPTAGAISDEQ
jgi:hypothetical protein